MNICKISGEDLNMSNIPDEPLQDNVRLREVMQMFQSSLRQTRDDIDHKMTVLSSTKSIDDINERIEKMELAIEVLIKAAGKQQDSSRKAFIALSMIIEQGRPITKKISNFAAGLFKGKE